MGLTFPDPEGCWTEDHRQRPAAMSCSFITAVWPRPLEQARESRDDSGPSNGHYFSVKLMITCTRTATGLPSFMPGLNSHCFIALTALASRP